MLSPPQPAETVAPVVPQAAENTALAVPQTAENTAVAVPETGTIAQPSTRNRLLTCSAMLLLAVIAERWLLASHLFPGDRWAAAVGMSHKSRLIWDITRVYQQVGRPLVAIGEVAAMLAWLGRRASRREIQGLLIVLLASACCGVIKILCGPTPLWMVLDHHVGTNFPSGVVTFMTATIGYIAVVAWRQGRRFVPIGLAIAILGAGPARVLGGQHLISDVLGAYMLGLAWLLLAYVYLVTPARRGRRQAAWTMPSFETLD
jgi:membrane-associated phospholipid phosphatase